MNYTDKITFRHTNGKVYTFKTELNPYSIYVKTQMWWFDPLSDMYAGTVKEAKIIAANIRKHAQIIDME